MSDVDYEALRYAAECATQGKWRNGVDMCHFDSPEVTDDKTFSYYVPDAKNAAFIASFNPAVALTLLAEIERLRKIVTAADDRIVHLTEARDLYRGRFKEAGALVERQQFQIADDSRDRARLERERDEAVRYHESNHAEYSRLADMQRQHIDGLTGACGAALEALLALRTGEWEIAYVHERVDRAIALLRKAGAK